MADRPEAPWADDEASLAGLAETIENIRQSLADVLAAGAQGKTRATLEACVAGLKRASVTLRNISHLQDATRARQVARESESVRSLAGLVSDAVGELARTNDDIASKLGAHIGELGQIAALPPGVDVAPRLRSTVARVRQMGGAIQEHLQGISSKVDDANTRIHTLESELESAREKASHDSLTRLHSRAALDEFLDDAIRRAGSSGPWCVLILDIDHFKHVNDTYGHVVGDAVLYNIALVLTRSLRWKSHHDILARYGGEEFAAVLAGADLAAAATAADRLRAAVAAARWQPRREADKAIISVTISIGVAQYRDGDTVAQLLERADGALYEAKRTGRNRVVAADDA